MAHRLLRPSLSWLLVFVPATLALRYAAPGEQTLVFVGSCLSIIPLAGWMGKATEHLAERTGAGVGGLLNATFGNAAELIIALMALREGLVEVVKASLTGSILGNILLVLGMALFTGGLRHPVQRFNATAARSLATMMSLAAIALIVPAAFHYLGGAGRSTLERHLSAEISVVLLLTYCGSLVFSLRTHKELFSGGGGEVHRGSHAGWSVGRSVTVLVVVTGLVAWVSEILVGSVEHAAEAFGMSDLFIGVVVVAVIGNAAEHSTAVLAAARNRMDLSLGIAVGSSLQVALFVAPVLVLASYAVGPEALDLVFTPFEVLAVVLAVAIAGQISGDGESNWLEGMQLLAVYAILAMAFYFLPAR